MRKLSFSVFDEVGHKPGYTTTKDSKMLEISDLGSRGIVLSTSLISGYHTADLCLYFCVCKKQGFS